MYKENVDQLLVYDSKLRIQNNLGVLRILNYFPTINNFTYYQIEYK